MFQHLLKIRYIAVIIVLLAVLLALGFLFIGGHIAVQAFAHLLRGSDPTDGRPGLELLHSLDFLFVSMVLIVLALGIGKLFLLDSSPETEAKLPVWLRIRHISELKIVLWETILTSLLIAGMSELSGGLFTQPQWTMLAMPLSILILSLSLYFMKKAH